MEERPSRRSSATRTVSCDGSETVLSSAIRQRQWKNAIARAKHSPIEVSTWVYKSITAGDTTAGEATPECIWKVLPIHQVCERYPPLEVVQVLLEIFPEGVREFSHGGQLPLHCACQWAASPRVIAALLMAYPGSVNVKDEVKKFKAVDFVNDSPCYGEEYKTDKEKTLELLNKGENFWKTATWEQVDRMLAGESEVKAVAPSKLVDVDAEAKALAASEKDEAEGWLKSGLTIIVVGASGDLAKQKTYPSLLNLFVDKFLPPEVVIYGYARSNLTHEGLRAHLLPYLKKAAGNTVSEDQIKDFLSRCFYQPGKSYDDLDAFRAMANRIEDFEEHKDRLHQVDHNRLFYFAIPPNVFAATGVSIKQTAMATRGWTRVIVEKPFGRDLETYEELSAVLAENFAEEQLYRMDHYLGKEMTQNLLVLRFSNVWFEHLWNQREVNCVMLTFKEPQGTEGRGGYFDKFGIIRDVLQNHLLQVFSLLAMEPPVKCIGPEAGQKIRDQKVQVLNATPPITADNVVLGQYEGYTDDPTITNKDSNTPTFATICMYVNTPRWAGVPFILKAGKALDERKTEIRVQFKEAPASSFLFEGKCPRNELVIRIQPKESIYMKTNLKSPGYRTAPVQSEFEVNYDTRFFNAATERDVNPDAYTRLILDVLRGRQAAFVRDDELKRSWEIFTPLLHRIENENIKPFIYKRGSRGPKESDEFIKRKTDFQRNEGYAESYRRAFPYVVPKL